MATQLPDGSVVVQPPGKRAVVPVGDGTRVRTPSVAAGAGPGATGKSQVRGRQPGRTAVSRDATK